MTKRSRATGTQLWAREVIQPALSEVRTLLAEANRQQKYGVTATGEPANLGTLYATLEAVQMAAFDAKIAVVERMRITEKKSA